MKNGYLAAIAALLLLPLPAIAQPPRTVIVISDLHIGVGRDAAGNWLPLEDFRWPVELDAFLRDLDRYGDVDLVLNGDTFELWQGTKNDCVHDDANLGCSETEALARFTRVATEHKEDLAAVSRFAARRDNRVIIVPGNHDAALLYDRVRNDLLTRLGGNRVEVRKSGNWLSSDGTVYAEHGQQIGSDPNKMADWPAPFLTVGGTRYLQKTWGEEFVQDFYNAYESRFPAIDNIAGESNGIRYGFKKIGFIGSLHAAGRFLKFALVDESARQAASGLGEGTRAWDLDATRAGGDAFVAAALASQGFPVLANDTAVELAGLSMATLGRDELIALCNTQLSLLKDHPDAPQCKEQKAGLGEPGEASGGLSAIWAALVTARNDALAARVKEVDTALNRSPSFVTFIYSHTHSPEKKFDIRVNGRNVFFANTGAWQHLASGAWARTWEDAHGNKGDVISNAVEAIPSCFTFVLVSSTDRSGPQLNRWVYDPVTRKGTITADSCE